MHAVKHLLLPLRAVVLVLLLKETVGEMNGEEQLYPYNMYINTREECMTMEMTNSLPDDGSPRCNRTWDTLLCWDEAIVNTTARQPCPSFYAEVPVYAYKTCWPNGSYNQWTNYTLCTDHPTEEGPPALQYLRIVYSIGYSLSLLALVIAMGIFSYFKKLRCPRNTIHMHLFVSFILRAVFMFMRDIIQAVSIKAISINSAEHLDSFISTHNETNIDHDSCNKAITIVITICQYALVSNYYWLLVEGVYLHALITLAVFSESSSLKLYIALGWGCPLMFVLPWVIVQEYTHTKGCWLDSMTHDDVYWIIKAPVMFSVVINFILFLNILRVLATKLNATNAAEARRYSKLAKSTLVLIPLFGVYYIVTIGMYGTENELVVNMRMYIELGLSSFQGFLVAVLYCFMNGEVRAEIRRKWHVRQLNRTLSTHRSMRNGHSRSSFSTPSRQDSLKEPLKDPRAADKNSIKAKLRALKRQAFGGHGSYGHHMGNGNMARPSQTAVSEIDNDSDSDRPRVLTEARVVRHPDPTEPNEKTKMNVHHTVDNTPTVIIDEVKDSDGYEEDIYRAHNDMNNEIEVEIDHEASGSCSTDACIDGGCEDRQVYPNIETEV